MCKFTLDKYSINSTYNRTTITIVTDLHSYEAWKLQRENYAKTFIFLIVVSAQVKNCEHDVMSNTHYR